MTNTNIEIMDRIIDSLAAGKKFSHALSEVYNKRNVVIPFNEEMFNVSLLNLHMSNRTTNALMRAKLRTLNDVLIYNQTRNIMTVKNFAKSGAIELMETIVDYAWNKMNPKERAEFLIDVVERNSENICK